MSGRKQRKGRRPARPQQGAKGGVNATMVFIALLVLSAAAVGLVAALRDGPPVECPPGQVWSDAHNHCH
jgi:hypothetical protein